MALRALIILGALTPSSLAAKGMIYGEAGRLDRFDPYTVHEASGHRLGDLLFDGLVAFEPSGSYRPGLAERWEVSADRTKVKFFLRQGVTWHQAPGAKGKRRPLTSKDVVRTVQVLKSALSEIPSRDRFEVLARAQAMGEDKVIVHLERAVADPLQHLTFKILPAHGFVNQHLRRGDRFALHPIGTGPYAFVRANAHGEVLLQANHDYFAGRPPIPQIIMKTFSDHNVMAQSLTFNGIDLITYVSPRQIAELGGDRNISLVPYDALSFSFLAFNFKNAHLKKRRVREALSLAIHRQEMLDAFFSGNGYLISGPFPPTSWAYNLDVQGQRYDPVRALKILRDAGYRRNEKDEFFRLRFLVPLAGENELMKRLVLAYRSYLERIHVGVDLEFLDWVAWKKKVLGRHDYDVTVASWSFDDSSNIRSLFHSAEARPWGNNFVSYRSKALDALLTEASVTASFDKKRAIYRKLHAMLAHDAPYCFLWTLKHHAAHNRRLAGVRVEPFAFFKHLMSWRLKEPRA